MHSYKSRTASTESSKEHALILQQITDLPAQPGTYIFRDAEGRPLYVGKAKSLKSRIRSYFHEHRLHNCRIVQMAESARYLETIITRTEGEALDLEDRLIKQMMPPYNIMLRDDRSYPFVRLEVHPGQAQVSVSYGKETQGIYFGPFFPASLAHDAVTFIRRHLLSSEDPRWIQWNAEGETKMDLRERVRWARKVLAGNTGATSRYFTRQMLSAVQAGRFEEAARCRNCLRVLKALKTQSRAAVVPNRNVDFIGISRRDFLTALNIFQFRQGEISDRFQMIVRIRESESELLLTPLRQIYSADSFPDRIVVPRLFQHDTLSGVPLVVPEENSDRAWIEIAIKNAQALLDGWIGRQTVPERSSYEGWALGEGNESRISQDPVILEERHTTYASIPTSNAFQGHRRRNAGAAIVRSSPESILQMAQLSGQSSIDTKNMNTKRHWSM